MQPRTDDRVISLLPEHISDRYNSYNPQDWDTGPEGDLWDAAADFIEELIAERAALMERMSLLTDDYESVIEKHMQEHYAQQETEDAQQS